MQPSYFTKSLKSVHDNRTGISRLAHLGWECSGSAVCRGMPCRVPNLKAGLTAVKPIKRCSKN